MDAELIRDYTTHLRARRRSPETIRQRLTYLRAAAAVKPLNELTIDDLELIISDHERWSAETVNAAVESWRGFYRWAVHRGRLAANPAEDLERVKVNTPIRVFADEGAIAEAMRTASARDKAILLLGRECALRRTEIATVRLDRIEDRVLTVVGKGSKVRRVKLSPTLLELVLEVADGRTSGYLFRGTAGREFIEPTTVYKIVLRLIGTPTHSLRRRSLTSVYRNSGGDIMLAKLHAGHASIETTQRYLQETDADLDRAAHAAAFDSAA